MTLQNPDFELIGAAGSRYRVNTPALVLDLDAFDRNLNTMARFCESAGVQLRPHAKTHKSTKIAHRQIELGAHGICCATLDEAEVMSEAALPGILITSPVVSAEKIERLMALLRKSPDVMIVVDNATNVEILDRAASRWGHQLQVLVDFDLGHHRTGVLHISDAIQLAQHVTAHAGLQFVGIQAYGGHLQHVADYSSRHKRARKAEQSISQLTKALTAAGLKPNIVTGAGTGTHLIDGTSGTFTELQAGSYIFMDAEYSDIEYKSSATWPFGIALFVQVAVISTNVSGTVTTDGGTKAFALNGPKPRIANKSFAGASYEFSGDEHGRIRLPDGVPSPQIADRLECIIPHCDPTVAHYDVYYCVRGDILMDIWPIDARGRLVLRSETNGIVTTNHSR